MAFVRAVFQDLGYDLPASFYWMLLCPIERDSIHEARPMFFDPQMQGVKRAYDACLHGFNVTAMLMLVQSHASEQGLLIQHGCGCDHSLAQLIPGKAKLSFEFESAQGRQKALTAYLWRCWNEYLLFPVGCSCSHSGVVVSGAVVCGVSDEFSGEDCDRGGRCQWICHTGPPGEIATHRISSDEVTIYWLQPPRKIQTQNLSLSQRDRLTQLENIWALTPAITPGRWRGLSPSRQPSLFTFNGDSAARGFNFAAERYDTTDYFEWIQANRDLLAESVSRLCP